jgi:hypothetical protein
MPVATFVAPDRGNPAPIILLRFLSGDFCSNFAVVFFQELVVGAGTGGATHVGGYKFNFLPVAQGLELLAQCFLIFDSFLKKESKACICFGKMIFLIQQICYFFHRVRRSLCQAEEDRHPVIF